MKMMFTTLCAVVSLLISAPANQKPAANKSADAKQARVLLVTGCDVPSHQWRKTTSVLREQLEQTGKFEVVVCEEPLVLESSALASYDVILINYYNWKRPSITPKAQKNLTEFVRNGKGLVSFHLSCRAFGDWPEYRDLIGRVWVKGSGHGPRKPFKTKITDTNHFITAGLSDFDTDDELYAKLVGDAKINVLIEAYSDWSKRTEPLAWTLNYGKGRVFNIVLGHDVKALSNPNFAKLLTQGTQWVVERSAK